MTTRLEIVTAARAWINTPWHHQARVRGVGTDCIGLIGGVAIECGVAEGPAWANDQTCQAYGGNPDPRMLIRACDQYLNRIPIWQSSLGDILLFKMDQEPQHFGIISRENPAYIIHAFAQIGRVVENRLDSQWQARTLRAYRFRGLV